MNRKTFNLFAIAILIALAACSYSLAQMTVKSKPISNALVADQYLKRHLRTARSLIKIGNYQKALTLLRSLKKNYPDLRTIDDEIKNAYRGLKDYPALKKIILSELKKSPDDFNLQCQLGDVYFLTDSLEQAKTAWEKAFDLAGDSRFKITYLASYYTRYGFYDEAAALYQRAAARLGEPAIFAGELADIYITKGDYKNAVGEYLDILQNNPKRSAAIARKIINIAEKCKRDSLKDHTLEIVSRLNEAIRNHPKNSKLYAIMGDLNMLMKNPEAAFDNYRHADKLTKGKGQYIFNFIALCYDNNEYAMAIKAADYYRTRIKGKNNPRAWLLKARSLEKLGRFEPALAVLDSLGEAHIPGEHRLKLEAALLAGDIYKDRIHNLQAAKNEYGRIAEDRNAGVYGFAAKLRLAELLIMQADFDKAETILAQLKKLDNTNDVAEQAEFLSAEIAFYRHDFKKAKTAYERLFKKYPSGYYVNDCLKRQALLVDAEGDTVLDYIADAERCYYSGYPDSAITIAEKAAGFEQSPAYEYTLFMLAEYYYNTGRTDKAISTYEKYSATFPDGVYADQALFKTAILYKDKKDLPEKANKLLDKLINDYPNSPVIEQARQYLNRLKSI